MRTLIITILIAECFMLANSQCHFTKTEVERETRVVTILHNNVHQLFHEDNVAVGTTLYFICSEHVVAPVVCQPNNRFSVPLPIANCPTPPKATVEKIIDYNCNKEAYRVGYKIGPLFLEIYRSYYIRFGMQIVKTTHLLHPSELVTDRPQQQFTTDGIISSKDAASFERRNVYYRFKKLLGDKQTYISSPIDGVIDRGHVVPSGDYLYVNNKAETFKYVNVFPQFASINRGNWKTLESWVRQYVRANGAAQIDTGAFEVLILKDTNNNPVAMYLADGDRNPIPKWIYKVVKNTQGVVQYIFVTYNNIYETQPPPAPCTATVTCPLQLKNTAQHGFTYCCTTASFYFECN